MNNEWKPINTAPKVPDKPIVVWVKGNGPAVVSWEPNGFTELPELGEG